MGHVVVIGGGGNIGSHLVPHLGRSSLISRVTVVDRDRYTEGNLRTQAIDGADVGKLKAVVQARRLRKINPAIRVTALARAVEDIPLGLLRADVILACLDSRRSRMTVNQAAWRLGVPWINAGVDGEGLLARVQAFVPASGASCLECAWDRADYDAVEQDYPCSAHAPAASGAPSALGALAGALQAIECDKLLGDGITDALAGRDLMIDAKHHRHFVTAFRRNPDCRMPDHAGWQIDPLAGTPDTITLGELSALGSILRGANERLTFRVAGQRLVVGLTCLDCGAARPSLVVERSFRRQAVKCPLCHGRLRPLGFDLADSVPLADAGADRDRPLSRIGIRAGDVVSLVTPAVETHYQIGGGR